MRPWLTALTAVLAIAVAAALSGGGTAHASTGSIRFSPSAKQTAWNATSFTVDVQAQNIVTTSQCRLDPNDPNSPTAPCGLGGFEFTVSFDPTKLQFISATVGGFLGSTGRSLNCFDPTVGAGTVSYQCVSLGQLPLGPQGTGILASLSFRPLVGTWGSSTPLDISGQYVDVAGNAFPATPTDGSVTFGKCGDVNNDGSVDLADTLAVLQRFGQSVPPADPKYDLAPPPDNSVDLGDALYTLAIFGQACTI